MDTLIQIVPYRNYIASLNMASDGQTGVTHEASIRWTDNTITKAFVKIYSPEHEQGLVNEITGYLLAYGCGNLLQPPRAGLIQVPKVIFNEDYQKTINGNFIWGWVTQNIGKTPNTFLPDNEAAYDACMEVLKEWPHLEALIAFDDWIANEDRNTGNLVMLSKGEFGIIDHGNAPVKIDWKPIDLNIVGTFSNKLLRYLYNETPPLPTSMAIVNAAKCHQDAYHASIVELLYWWDMLLSSERKTALESFIKARAQQGQIRLQTRTGLLVA